jgi:pimeloyl-ACP methyl ester carboxylesterase
MKTKLLLSIIFVSSVVCACCAVAHAQAKSSSPPPVVKMIPVAPGVQLEVLDWGGSGPSLVFLTGMGNTAQVYDRLARKLTPHYHVYGITRRGWGASSKPAPTVANYAADRLGDDVVAVMNALHLDRPVLIGHSIAGEELSSVGSRYPKRVAGLIYLDAADGYGFYNRAHGDWRDAQIDMNDVRRQIDALEAGALLSPQFVREMLASVTHWQQSLVSLNARLALMPSGPPPPPPPPIGLATLFGEEKYTAIPVPVLAIFACPHSFERMYPNNAAARAAITAEDRAGCGVQADAFGAGVPTATVVRIPDADHYVFVSNEAQVLSEMNRFLARLFAGAGKPNAHAAD